MTGPDLLALIESVISQRNLGKWLRRFFNISKQTLATRLSLYPLVPLVSTCYKVWLLHPRGWAPDTTQEGAAGLRVNFLGILGRCLPDTRGQLSLLGLQHPAVEGPCQPHAKPYKQPHTHTHTHTISFQSPLHCLSPLWLHFAS